MMTDGTPWIATLGAVGVFGLVAAAQEVEFRSGPAGVLPARVVDAAPRPIQPPADPVAPPSEAPPTPVDAPGPAPAIASRADLARHYLRVDQLFMPLVGDGPRRVGPEKIAELNRDFDAASMMFLSTNFPRAIAKLEELAQKMLTTGGGEMLPTIGTPITVSVEPPVWWAGSPATPRVRVGSFLPASVDEEVKLELDWDDGRASPIGRPRLEKAIEVKKGRVLALEVPLTEFGAWHEGSEHWPVGNYAVRVTLKGHREFGAARFCVVPASLDAARIRNEKALAEALAARPDLDEAVKLCRARNRVLVDYPGSTNPEEFLADYPSLVAEIAGEVEAVGNGKNPYARRVGEIYRPIIGRGTPDGKPVPCMVYAPKAAADDTPRPLVIALHGAGGDESMFIRGYGAGRLVQLAEEKGFIVASAQSYKLGGREAVFDLLLDQLGKDYAIDRSRVYVIGHSMGAGAATYFAGARPDTVAGVVCFAGLGRPGARTAPMLVYAGALDPIVRPDTIRAAFEEARSRNLPIELREEPDYGHTLIVGAKMGEAVEWLLKKSLGPAPKP